MYSRRFKVPKAQIITPYCSHSLITGMSGQGKSVWVRWLEEEFYRRGCKIIDLYDDGAYEGDFIAFPANNPLILNKFTNWIGNAQNKEPYHNFIGGYRPKGYLMECYVPAVPELPRKLPNCFKPFTISFNDLTKYEFSILLGKLSGPEKLIMSIIWDNLKKKENFGEFLKTAADFILDSRITIQGKNMRAGDVAASLSLLQKINSLGQSGIVSDDDDPRNLDLDKIMKDKKTITTFSFAEMDDENKKHLLRGYLLRKIYTMRKIRKYSQYPELVLLHRELQNSAPARGKFSSEASEGQKIALEYITKIMGEPRFVKIRLIADTQTPKKLDATVRTGFTNYFMFKMNQTALDSLVEENFTLPIPVYFGIPKLEQGQYAVASVPQKDNPLNQLGIGYPHQVRPPESYTREPDDFFFKMWKKEGGGFTTRPKEKEKEDLIKITRMSQEDKDAPNAKKLSYYESQGRIIMNLIREKGSIAQNDILKHPLIKDVWEQRTFYNLLDGLSKSGKIERYKEGKFLICTLPKPNPAPSQSQPKNETETDRETDKRDW